LNQYFSSRKRYFLTEFYIDQRKKHQLMLNANGTPQGGKWTYDQENRKKLPKNLELPPSPVLSHPKEQFALMQQLQAQYPHHYGEVAPPLYAINYAQAGKVLDQFLEQRFRSYGTYQDALHPGQSFLFHSLISPALNIGLLDPLTIVKQVIDYAQKEKIPLNQTEGFVRQILGWREFLRAVYEREGVKERTRNFWGFKESLPKAFWTGTTGIPPVDQVIHRLLQTGYSHHIERLMVLGNFMCLCEIDPDAVYEWFMTMYIDAYDWVMVPNVYGMSQFADGGLMSTKPYISGSNYILKMSSYPKGDWCAVWDALFWRFLYRHKTFFKTNPRLSMLLGHLDRMSAETKKSHFRTADQFLQKLYA
ncbi:MAG: cryptochrome/photolyase family protein, partial [Chitinophagaceae bacterium]